MAYEFSNYSVKLTFVAGADLSAYQYRFVKLDTSNIGNVIAIAANTDKPIGVLQNAPISGQEAEVLTVGGTKLVVDTATVTVGDAVGPGAAVTATKGGALTVTAGTNYNCGTALQTGATAGIVITAVVDCARAIKSA
jgi:hypothetical protein